MAVTDATSSSEQTTPSASRGNETSDDDRPQSTIVHAKKGRRVWGEVYPDGDMMIELGGIDCERDCYFFSDEAVALARLLDELGIRARSGEASVRVAEARGLLSAYETLSDEERIGTLDAAIETLENERSTLR